MTLEKKHRAAAAITTSRISSSVKPSARNGSTSSCRIWSACVATFSAKERSVTSTPESPAERKSRTIASVCSALKNWERSAAPWTAVQ